MKVNEFLGSTGLQSTSAVTFDQLRAILEDDAPSAQPQNTAPPATAHVATPSPATPAPGSTPPGGVATPPAA